MRNITIDLHGYTANEALDFLNRRITNAPERTKTITVIHGNIHGTVLRDTVRGRLHNDRIQEITPLFSDDGVTILYLK